MPIIAPRFSRHSKPEPIMNFKTLAFLIFAAWTAICWRWYVCGIKEACGEQQDVGGIVVTPAIEPDTIVATQPTTTPAIQPIDENDIDKVQMEEVEDRMVIHFPYSSTRKEDSDAIDSYLNHLAQQLKSSGGTVTINGHTDFVGDSKTNYSYGLRRAYGIRDILIKKGVKKSQITCKSFGERKPVATNDNARGRYMNRRVEIRVKN